MSSICVVTIHGIGFQQAPQPGVPGYADQLHDNLRATLPTGVLGDDPRRPEGGPVYVASCWPRESGATEPGLARVGRWAGTPAQVVVDGAPLVADGAVLSHVALVYSQLEEVGADPLALTELNVMAATGAGSYGTVRGLLQLVFGDIGALLAHHAVGGDEPGVAVRPSPEQSDSAVHPSILARLREHLHPSAGNDVQAAGLAGVIRTLSDDVAAYACRNDLRERVRRFVRDVLTRLACREDVAGIVINAHSNGVVMGWDFLASLPVVCRDKVLAFVTSGSPLRKYVDLLAWGNEMGIPGALAGEWVNLWDPHDPVADPLGPPKQWRRGQRIPGGPSGLCVVRDPLSGAMAPLPVRDIQVDNVTNSRGGGLRAHNYWDNREYLEPVAEILHQLCRSRAGILSGSARSAP